jgi:hypothetical protein
MIWRSRSTPLDGLGALVITQLPLAAELYSSGHSSLPAFASAFADQVALKVGNGGKQRGPEARAMAEGARQASLDWSPPGISDLDPYSQSDWSLV